MDTSKSVSPKWTNTTKLIIGLSLLTIIAFLFSRFQTLLAPLLVTFILTYLMYSPAYWIMKRFHMNWRLSVTLLFVFLLLLIIGLLTWGGLALVNQGQSLVAFLEKTIVDLPTTIDNFLHTPFAIGPFTINLNQLNLTSLGNQIVSSIQPMLGNLGSFLGTLATGAASTIGWLLFIMLMSYFILAETEGKPERIFRVTIPGYEEDIRHMGVLLGRVWNAFLRGQFLIIAFVIAVYSILFGALGLRYFFGLAIIAGLARFLPYIGPFIAWTTYGLVAYFQGTTIFGFEPFMYAVFVVGVAWLTDVIIDNFVSTRVMADSLAVHPAAILVAALIGANLIGIAGMILAAPVLATLQLFFQYTMRKMFDLDPWEGVDLSNRKKQEVNLLPIIKQAWKTVKHRFNVDTDQIKTGRSPHQKERDEK
ncbi:MAG: AI-2E family transporter [Leptolinea sp.]|jgi:predicted PurR-regulated permease PerM|nr:AI-2E family transporter [Leptolinea sp.]